MTKYKFNDKEETTVNNIETGQSGISKGVWLWRGYQEWLEKGNVTEPFKTEGELAADLVEAQAKEERRIRRRDIDVAVEEGGMKHHTVAQAEAFLQTELGKMSLPNADKLILFKILKKITHRIL
jgi:hypothetical protein